LNDLVAKNLVIKRTRKANKKYQSDHEKLYMRNWTYAASWVKKGRNPFEALESKAPDPPRVGEQGPEDFLVTTGEIGCTRNISIHMPQSYNPLNKDVVNRIDALLKKYETGKMINTVNFSGYDGSFCTGLDYGYLFSHRDLPEGREYLKKTYQMAFTLATMQTPVATFLDGISLGAGNALFLHAPIRFATDRGLLAVRDTEVGWFPDAGVCHALAKLENGLGMYLALSGHAVEGADLYFSGLANYWCLSSAVSTVKLGIGACYSPRPERVVMAVESSKDNPLRQNNKFSEYEASIARCFTKDTLEGVIAALQDDGGGWALRTLEKIRKANPVSVLVTFRLMKLAEKKSLEETIQTEYYIAQQFLKTRDLYEGIEKLVLKDPAEEPEWQYKSIEQVPKAEIDKYFSDKGKEKISLEKISDNPPHEVVDRLSKSYRQFEVENIPKEEAEWRKKMSAELLEAVLPYIERTKKEIDKLTRNVLEPQYVNLMAEADLYAEAIIQKRSLFDPVAEVNDYLISKTSPEDKKVKELTAHKKYVTNAVAKAQYLQALFRELMSSKTPEEAKLVSQMNEDLDSMIDTLYETMRELEQEKKSVSVLVPELEKLQDFLYRFGEVSMNEKEREIIRLLKFEYLITLSEEEIYQRLHDRVFSSHFVLSQSKNLLKVFKRDIDTALEESGVDEAQKELKDFVTVWKLQIDQLVSENKLISNFRKKDMADVPAEDQKQVALQMEQSQFIQDSSKELTSDLNIFLLEELSKVTPKIYNATPATMGDYYESSVEYLKTIQDMTPKLIEEFFAKNSKKITAIFAESEKKMKLVELAEANSRLESIKTPVPFSKVKERANKLLLALPSLKTNFALADHVHALMLLRHSVNQELHFLISPIEREKTIIGGNQEEIKELETVLRSLISGIDKLLLKPFVTPEKVTKELQKSTLPSHLRITHEYFAPELVISPELLNIKISSQINPVREITNTIDDLLSSGVSNESVPITFLRFKEKEMKNLYKSLGTASSIYKQKLAFGLPEFNFSDPEKQALAFSDFHSDKIDFETYLERSGLPETIDHYRQHGFSDTELVRIRETWVRIFKFQHEASKLDVPSREITSNFIKRQLETERLNANQRKEMQSQLKKLSEGVAVGHAVPYLGMKGETDDGVEIKNDPNFEVNEMTSRLRDIHNLVEANSIENMRANLYQSYKADGISIQKQPITNDQLLDEADRLEEIFDDTIENSEVRKEYLNDLNKMLKIGAAADAGRQFNKQKADVDDQIDALSVLLGKVGKYYDPLSPNAEDRIKSQVQESLLLDHESLLDPQTRDTIEGFRSKMQNIKSELERAEIETFDTISKFKLTESEFAILIAEAKEKALIVPEEEALVERDIHVKSGDMMEGMSQDEIADYEQEIEWGQPDSEKMDEEDKV